MEEAVRCVLCVSCCWHLASQQRVHEQLESAGSCHKRARACASFALSERVRSGLPQLQSTWEEGVWTRRPGACYACRLLHTRSLKMPLNAQSEYGNCHRPDCAAAALLTGLLAEEYLGGRSLDEAAGRELCVSSAAGALSVEDLLDALHNSAQGLHRAMITVR